ncbi:MAG: DUF87 domain-containing protein [Desulfurococcales archaeon]|nr:DUF87 domain-containing protein [Desulfurococcales archaeon]
MEASQERPTIVVCPGCKRLTTNETGYCHHCGASLELPLLSGSGYEWDIYLGRSLGGERTGILSRDLRRHMTILGMVGYGKTLLTKRLVLEASKMGVNYTILDWEGEYGDIASVTGGVVLGYGPRETPLRINLFNREDMDPMIYSSMLFSTMSNVLRDNGWDMTPQMESLLRDSIEEAVARKTGPKGLLDLVMEKSSEYPQGRQTAYALKSRLAPLLRGVVSRVFRDGDTLRPLMGRRVVIDLSWVSRVSAIEAQFLSRLIMGLFYYEAIRTGDSPVLKHLLVVEEAEEVLSPAGCGGEVRFISPVSYMMHLRRKGVGLIIVAHSPKLLDPGVLRMTGNMAVFRIDNYEDARFATGMLGNMDLMGEVQSLGVGEALVKPSSAGEPFKLMVDMPDASSDGDYVRLISHIREYPYLAQRDRRAMLGMSSSKFARLVRRGLEEGVLETVTVNTGRGRPVKLLQVKGDNPGAAHHFLEHRIKGILDMEGCRYAVLERGPDIVVFRESDNICIEIETGTNISEGKYMRFLEYCDKMIIVCSTRRCILRVSSIMARDPGLQSRATVTLLAGLRRSLRRINACSTHSPVPGN